MTRSRLVGGGVLAIALFTSLRACTWLRHSHPVPRLIVLGIDGMDPGFVERHWSALPNLARLRDEGQFQRLGTTTPPQSPVAWSTFITGLQPAEHGLFDFVHRDAKTLQPFSSMTRTGQPRWVLPVGSYQLPLLSAPVVSLRHGIPFWQILSKRGIPSTILRMPTNYPPVNAGYALSGMGTPDLRGTLGTFSFYTADPEEASHSVSGGRIIKVHVENGHVVLPIEGPPNSLRKDQPDTSIDLVADVDPNAPVVRLALGDHLIVLKQGEWSSWLTAEFPLIPHLSSVSGMFRVFVKQLHPVFELYLSPLNIDPVSPALPVSSPNSWARAVAQETGRFSTLGIPEDTSALRQDALSHSEFRSQAQLVLKEEQELLRYALKHFDRGLLFFYFSSIDQNSHMLWGRYEDELLNVYTQIDASIGEVRHAFPGTRLIILSDHGFATFDRAVHLNTWLKNRGFLSLTVAPHDATDLSSVDWRLTEAYAIGLNGLYLNLRNREAHGIVVDGEQSRALLQTVSEQLRAWRDPATGRPVVKSVFRENSSGSNAAVAPDLIVGYAPGYRASWQTALGGAADQEIENNTDAWIADHCIDPTAVPGVLFTTWRTGKTNPRLQDVRTLILQFFH